MRKLNRKAIQAKLARAERWVDVPELGGAIRVVPPSLERLFELRGQLGADDPRKQSLVMLMAMCPDLGDDVATLLDADGVVMSAVINRVMHPITDDRVGE